MNEPPYNIDQTAPNLFVIGAPKCGTTSLYDYLVRYPGVASGLHKEPHYFCDDFDSIRQATTLAEYLGCYQRESPAEKYFIDASTNYIYSDRAVANILQFDPNAKIIVMLRNPIDLVRSLYDHLRFRQMETEPDLAGAWNLGPVEERVPAFIKSTPYPGHLSYKLAGALGEKLKPIWEAVPEQNRLALFLDDLIGNRKSVMHQVLEFLDISMNESIDLEKRNKAKQVRSQWMNRVLMYPPKSLQPIKSVVKQTVPATLVRKLDLFSRINRAPREKTRMSAEFRSEVSDYFADDIRLLAQLTGRNLDHWLEIKVPGSAV